MKFILKIEADTREKLVKGNLKTDLNRMCSLLEDALTDLAAREIKFRDSLQRTRTMRQKETDKQSRSYENSLLTIGTNYFNPTVYL